MTTVFGTDPRTGEHLDPVAEETTQAQVGELAAIAAAAAARFAGLDRATRAQILDDIAERIEAHRADLIQTANRETGFGEAKLGGELTRAAYQFRFFGEVLREGSYLEAAIDPAGDTPMGPRPDLRRILTPIGPVAVFGSSNFPFAFSVLGGDVASALAAGNPIIIKAHSSHPGTSALSHARLAEVLDRSAAPQGTIGIVYGTTAGAALVAHPAIKAVGFTGSLSGGKALLDIIAQRPEPIPFYGELSSLNPVIITPGAAAERAEEIGAGLVASVTLGSGQLCTKPGFVLIPEGADGDRLLNAALAALEDATGHVLLNKNIHTSYTQETAALSQRSDVHTYCGPPSTGAGFAVSPMLVETTAADMHGDIAHEVFGPLTVITRYAPSTLLAAAATMFATLPDSLTATLHTAVGDDTVPALTELAAAHAGRIVYNGYPTGVAVSWAQHHGGPWPSTNSLYTSVGATAIRRFLRPLTYQNAPEDVLPDELRDGYTAIPRRINGVLHCTAKVNDRDG